MRRVDVFGPAYLDRVVRVDRPLIDPGLGPPLDQSVDGRWKFGSDRTVTVSDAGGYILEIDPPGDWPGPTGEVELDRPIRDEIRGQRSVRGLTWHDDLGGMGAGFAAAFGGVLHSALGPEADPMSQRIARLLVEANIVSRPTRVLDHSADWTLLLTSGAFGDKLPIGFRGCHASLDTNAFEGQAAQPCDLRVVASLPNRVAASVLRPPGAGVRFFAPSTRNMLDRDCPLSSFAGSIDVLSCNRREWELLDDREEVAWQVSILAVTDGPAGSAVRFTTPQGEPGCVVVPAFPRACPPQDTNRAGEAYAAALIATLLDHDWRAASGIVDQDLIEAAAQRAAAAAALVLDHAQFGFPSPSEIDAALLAGRIA
jgi:sugar/nucleoside kinase (ribokinase family)